MLAAAGLTVTASAEQALNIRNQILLRQQRAELNNPTYAQKVKALKGKLNTPSNQVLAMVKLADGATEEDLVEAGATVYRVSHGFGFISMPIDEVEKIAAHKCIRQMQIASEVYPKMDKSRAASGVDKIHQGIGLPQAYTGKGVICGIVDQGIDPNHINFKDADGNPRVGWMASLTVNAAGTGLNEKYYQRDEVPSFTTDDQYSYHGTHTLGTMAGGYRGNVKLGEINESTGTVDVVEKPNPYYGVAYDADICLATGDLLDMAMAYGVDYILQYAAYEQKPCVINLSIGNPTGAHDGTSVLCQYFDAVKDNDNALICLSAGNEGDMKIALHKTFTETDKTLQTFIEGYDHETYGYTRQGMIQIYSKDSTRPTKMQMFMYNKSRDKFAGIYDLDLSDDSENVGAYWVSTSSWASTIGVGTVDSNFAKRFDGFFGGGWSYDEYSGRWTCTIEYYITQNATGNADSNYLFGFLVEGEEGQRFDCFNSAEYSYMSNNDIAGFDDGMNNGSISDIATSPNTLAVGSYDTREIWPALDGNVYETGGSYITTGEISKFSSYGTLIDGRNLPDVCAPGAVIISSSSSYFQKLTNEGSSFIASTTSDRGDEYWTWSTGTSMASPLVAGSIALWLEADPNLTMAEIKDIIKKTAIVDEAVLRADPVQAGAGKFDAYEGLKEVIRRKQAGVGSLADNDARLVAAACGDRSFNVFLGGADKLDVTIFDITGKPVYRNAFTGDEANINLSSLSMGVYILNVNGRHSTRLLVK